MRITDRLEISDRRTTKDGYLVTNARFARSGIYNYSGRDLGKPEMDTVRVFRPADEVFSADAMASFAHRPITNDHPDGFVDASNWRDHAVGFTDGKVARDGDFVMIPMMVTDQAAIRDITDGKTELSAGYDCEIEFLDGQTSEGQKYDAIMRDIRGNHIAIVDRGRAGPECRVGDQKETKMADLKKILVDGFQVETTEAGEAAILKLQNSLRDSAANIERLRGEHVTAIEAKDRELATKDAEIDGLKGKVVEGAALDKLVADRAALVATAGRLVANFDAAGKSAAEIKRAVVSAKCGDAAVKDKTEAYVEARFDTLVEGLGGVDQVREVISHGSSRGTDMIGLDNRSVDDLRRDEEKALGEASDLNSWRTKK